MRPRLPAVTRPALAFTLRPFARPTWVAQGINALASLLLVALLTRHLPVADFATYAAVMAAYAFSNALVGTTIGTRAIEGLSAGGRRRIALHPRRDAPAAIGCVWAAVATSLIARADPLVALAAAVGMLGILAAELGGAYLLGLRRYWTYAALTLAQMTLWIGAVIAAVRFLAPPERLPACLAAVAIGGAAPALYLLVTRAVILTRGDPADRTHTPVSAVGVANLALWLLASGDRIILARYALTALATYAALYGLLDRVFRTLANAEIQQRLPHAFIDHSRRRGAPVRCSPRGMLALLALAIACAGGAPAVVGIVSGGRYHPSLVMSAVLSLAMCAMLMAVPPYVSLIARGRAGAVALAALVAASVDIAGNLALAGTYGTASAAVLTLAGYLIWLGALTLAERRAWWADRAPQSGRAQAAGANRTAMSPAAYVE